MSKGYSGMAAPSNVILANTIIRRTPPSDGATITGWQRLTEFALRCTRGKWIYRGETFTTTPNPLLPKAGRPDWNKLPNGRYSLRKEQLALAEFSRQGISLVNPEPRSDLEWLAIAQHHGMPTRLLDWTENILVAAFFATERMNTSNGIIYAARDLPYASKQEQRWPFKVTRPCVYRPPHISRRISAQSGVFTLQRNPGQPFKAAGLRSWTITPRACSEIKEVLDGFGISRSSLFPDLDGVSDGLAWRYKWGRL